MAKVINDKLVIRVGGGYMGAEKFIQQYGPMEMAKILEATGQSPFKGPDGQRMSMSGPAQKKIMDQLREKMKSTNAGQALSEGLNAEFGVG